MNVRMSLSLNDIREMRKFAGYIIRNDDYFSALPEEILLLILSKLQDRDLLRIGKTSKLMKKTASNDRLWCTLFQEQLPKPVPVAINLARSSPYKALFFYKQKTQGFNAQTQFFFSKVECVRNDDYFSALPEELFLLIFRRLQDRDLI